MKTYLKHYFKTDFQKITCRIKKAQQLINEKENIPISEISLFDIVTMSGFGGFSPQKRTSFIEDKLVDLFKWKPVKASENKGDYIDKNNKYFELKCSATNDQNTINILQIRPWQEIDYYRIIYFDLDDSKNSKSYILSKEQMLSEINKRGNATHGTKEANIKNNNIEYSIHLPINNDWDLCYLDKTFFNENRIW